MIYGQLNQRLIESLVGKYWWVYASKIDDQGGLRTVRGNYRLTTQSARNVNNNLHVLAITMGPEEELSSTCLCVCVCACLLYEQGKKERKRARRSRDLPQREEIKHLRKLNLYILSTHTNNCAHTFISEDTAYPTED